MARDFEEENHDEPLVFEVVAESELAMEVRDLGGAEEVGLGFGGVGEGEGEGFVLPYVVGGIGRDCVENLEVKIL